MYGFEGTPFLLPRFFTNKLFVSELCRQYLYWSFFFEKKHKNQFLQIPFSVENVRIKSLLHLRKVEGEYKLCEFVEGPAIQGFDPKGIFVSHLNFFRLYQSL